MLVFAGFGMGRRLVVSVFAVQLLRLFIVYTKGIIIEYLFFPIAYFESILLGLFMILGLLMYQRQVGVRGVKPRASTI